MGELWVLDLSRRIACQPVMDGTQGKEVKVAAAYQMQMFSDMNLTEETFKVRVQVSLAFKVEKDDIPLCACFCF